MLRDSVWGLLAGRTPVNVNRAIWLKVCSNSNSSLVCNREAPPIWEISKLEEKTENQAKTQSRPFARLTPKPNCKTNARLATNLAREIGPDCYFQSGSIGQSGPDWNQSGQIALGRPVIASSCDGFLFARMKLVKVSLDGFAKAKAATDLA